MPTGYTADIEKGISFEDFVLRCARSFGVPISGEFKPSDYYEKELKKAKTKMEIFKKMSPEQYVDKASIQFSTAQKEYDKNCQKCNLLKEKYHFMLEQIKAWTPPTLDHQGLKKFMIEQIERSIRYDCSMPTKPEKLTGKAWAKQEIKELAWDIAYHAKEDLAEKERAKEQTLWIKQLRESLLPPVL